MDYTIIGKIVNTHGIRGEVRVYPLTTDIKRFSSLKKAYIGEEKLEVNLTNSRYHKGLVIIKFKEFDDINDIISYKDNYIYVDDENIIDLPKDHFFIHDLISCQVVDTSGNEIGFIEDVLQMASNDVYVIKDNTNNKTYLIPAVKEFISKVDIKNKKIIVDPIEGMIE